MKTNFLSLNKLKIKINKDKLLRDISLNNSRVVEDLVEEYITPKIEEVHREMLASFEAHPVTSEIKSGPKSSNKSGLLGGYGNLFSFIGFSPSDSPIDAVMAILSQKPKIKVRKANKNGGYLITASYVNQKELYFSTPMPWLSGSSWVEGIEKGISNLGSYIYSDVGFNVSRSGSGLQAKNKKSSVKFKTTPYLSKIIRDYKEKLKNIK